MREIIRHFAVFLFIACFVGCGGEQYGPTGRVNGKLTMDGKQLPAGHAVSFMQMEKGFLAFGITDAEGRYEIKSWNNGNMPIGKYDVMIAPPSGEADVSKLSAEDRFEQGGTSSKSSIAFPKRYRETTTSGLQFEIAKGENHCDIDLKSK
jgi:hypothetical protein